MRFFALHGTQSQVGAPEDTDLPSSNPSADPQPATGIDFARELLHEVRRGNQATEAQMTTGHAAIVAAIQESRRAGETRHLELVAAVKKIDDKPDEGGVGARLFAWFERLPVAVQMGMALAAVQIGLAWGGALWEQVFNVPPPQTTVPVLVQEPPVSE